MMRNQHNHTRSNQRDSLGGKRSCRHNQLNGVWICCMCENGPNRYGNCVFTRIINPDNGNIIDPCNHRPCDACTAYVSQRRR